MAENENSNKSGTRVLTFGYRYPRPSPIGAALVLDARCLIDPAEKRDLGTLTGFDVAVREYLGGMPDVQRFIAAGVAAARAGVPCLAVGCHSGRHRSVYIAERIAETLGVTAEHLDILRVPDADIAPDYI